MLAARRPAAHRPTSGTRDLPLGVGTCGIVRCSCCATPCPILPPPKVARLCSAAPWVLLRGPTPSERTMGQPTSENFASSASCWFYSGARASVLTPRFDWSHIEGLAPSQCNGQSSFQGLTPPASRAGVPLRVLRMPKSKTASDSTGAPDTFPARQSKLIALRMFNRPAARSSIGLCCCWGLTKWI
jgi:hypothetical protein